MNVDLNLLVALDALIDEGSVAAAAARLHLSAPAMSRTLARIRRTMGDQILVRTGRGMTRTPHALAIREHVRALVQQAEAVFAREQPLDLAALERTFTVRCHDNLATAVAPALLAAIPAQAPGVTVRLLAEADADTGDLRRGHVDVELGVVRPKQPELRSETLVHDDLVAAFSPDHPCAGDELTEVRYAAASHVTVSRHGRLRDTIDDVLATRGLARRVVAAVPTSATALAIVAGGEFLAAVPRRACGSTVRALGLRTAPLPVAVPPVPVVCSWHRRYDDDKAHAWLRQLIRTAFRAE